MKKTNKKPIKIVEWLRTVERLIGKHSTPPRKSGKYKGHSSTNSVAWVAELADLVEADIKRTAKQPYDENMAIASRLGMILSTWYCLVRKAKSYDPNRPLARRKANRKVTSYRGELAALLADDDLMGKVWGKNQGWNFPFGKGAKGGGFV